MVKFTKLTDVGGVSVDVQMRHKTIHFLVKDLSGWWFQTFFMFIPIWGNDPI